MWAACGWLHSNVTWLVDASLSQKVEMQAKGGVTDLLSMAISGASRNQGAINSYRKITCLIHSSTLLSAFQVLK